MFNTQFRNTAFSIIAAIACCAGTLTLTTVVAVPAQAAPLSDTIRQ